LRPIPTDDRTSATKPEQLAQLLQPAPDNVLIVVRVSLAVNCPKNDSPECVEPAA
jgi:putative SOS response-associated peptidase YedK